MTFLAPVWHLVGLLAPALALALLLWLGLGLGASRGSGARFPVARLGVLALAGAVVLVAGLVYFGRDGKVATYAALVLVQGSLGWWLRGR